MSDRKLYLCAAALVLAAPLFAMCMLAHAGRPGEAHEPACSTTARWLRYACAFDVRDDFLTAVAKRTRWAVLRDLFAVAAPFEPRAAAARWRLFRERLHASVVVWIGHPVTASTEHATPRAAPPGIRLPIVSSIRSSGQTALLGDPRRRQPGGRLAVSWDR